MWIETRILFSVQGIVVVLVLVVVLGFWISRTSRRTTRGMYRDIKGQAFS
jgi:hypothetical protein